MTRGGKYTQFKCNSWNNNFTQHWTEQNKTLFRCAQFSLLTSEKFIFKPVPAPACPPPAQCSRCLASRVLIFMNFYNFWFLQCLPWLTSINISTFAAKLKVIEFKQHKLFLHQPERGDVSSFTKIYEWRLKVDQRQREKKFWWYLPVLKFRTSNSVLR